MASFCGFSINGIFYGLYSDCILPSVLGKQFISDYQTRSKESWIELLQSIQPDEKQYFYDNTFETHIQSNQITVSVGVLSEPRFTYIVDFDKNVFIYKGMRNETYRIPLMNVHLYLFDHLFDYHD